MGKMTLLLVLAAVLASSTIMLKARIQTQATENNQSEAQHDMLVRELATSGHNLVLSRMLDSDGFRASLGFSTMTYGGGTLSVSYTPSPDRMKTQFTLRAFQGGAVHEINSRYTWLPPTFPGPLWLDAPYVTATIDPAARLAGGIGQHYSYLDRQKFDDLQLGSLLNFGTMQTALASQLDAVRTQNAQLRVETGMAALLDYYRSPSLEDLYGRALGAMEAGDATLGPTVIAGSASYGSTASPTIVRIQGGLTIPVGGRLTGTGLLMIEGPLTIEMGGTVEWNGLVMIRSDDSYLSIRNLGRLLVTGSMIIDQMGAPPGGHVDVTVFRDLTGAWAEARGDRGGSRWFTWGDYPWYEHTHKFDEETGGRLLIFADAGTDPQEALLKFRETLTTLGSEQVFLEFDNHAAHGMSRWELEVAGQPRYTGTVLRGFGAFSQGGVHRSQRFAANQLRDFTVNVLSLRLLKQRFDGDGCGEWPLCIGNDRHRAQALTIRLRRQSDNAALYETVVYWHKREDEDAEHAAAEDLWRSRIESGSDFGTRLTLGANTEIRFDIERIEPIGRRLGFTLPDIEHGGTTTNHWSPGQAGAPSAP